MAIDQFTDERINVRELSLPEPIESPSMFNAEEIITPDTFRVYEDLYFKKLFTNANRDITGQVAASLSITVPVLMRNASFPESVNTFVSRGILLATTSDLKILYPKQVDKIFIEQHEETKETMASRALANTGWERSRHLFDLFALYPEHLPHWNKRNEMDESIKKDIDYAKKHKEWDKLLINVFSWKLLHPSEKAPLSHDEWQGINTFIKSYRDGAVKNKYVGELQYLSNYAKMAKIASSHIVEMTDDGLKMSMNKTANALQTENTPAPERRRF